MRTARLILLPLALLALTACKPSLPSDVLPESKMERVLYDFHMAQGLVEHVPMEPGQTYDGVRYELHQAVFRKHGITQEQFDRSMSYYLSDMDHLAVIYEHVTARLEREAEALGVAAGPRDIYASLTAEGDTANVWADRPLFAIRNAALDNFQMWSMACDSTWQAGDELLWRFQLQQVTKTYGPGDLYADLVVIFTNDSVRSTLSGVASRQQVELRVDNPDGWTPRSVSGHFFTPVATDPQLARLYVATAPVLIRFHQQLPDTTAVLADSLALEATDSLTLTSADTLAPLVADPAPHRLSPVELRESQPVDRTIDVVKEKPYKPAPQRGNRRLTAPNRKTRP